MEAGTKMIVLDGPTQRFLEELPKLRGKLGQTRSEVAACLGVSAQTVSLWVRQGKLPAARGSRRNKRWLVSELLEYERSGKIRREANDEV